ncbi:MAG: Polysaccharide biosynthesis protein [Parcubacteria group bacterium GW2011_GWC2_38_7]|nr:MAG: Polysaccharide biosynthesis protein [Parcubacteria group bacterium GW2011_GWC2_38_7]
MQSVSVTKNTSYLTLSYIAQKVLSFLYFVLVARAIGVEDLGKYTFALSFTTIFAVFVDWGLTQALITKSAKEKGKIEKYLGSILATKLFFSLIVYALVVLVINLMHYPEITKNLVYVCGVIMLLDQVTLTFWGVFRGQRNLKYEAISVIINQALILISGLFILWLKLPLIYLLIPYLIGSSFSLVFSTVSCKKILKIDFWQNCNLDNLRLIFKIALPFALIAIFSRVYGYLDTVMLSKLVGDKAVGWYSVAMKIPFAFQFIPAALAAAIFPAFSYQFVHDKAQLKLTYERVMRFLAIIVLPIAVGIGVLAKPIIMFFYGSEYLPSVLSLQILMASLFFVFINFPLGSLLNGCERQNTNTKLVGLTMVLNIALNLLLIPKFSFIGSSISFLVCQIFLFGVSAWVAQKISSSNWVAGITVFAKTAVGAGAMGLVIQLLITRIHFIVLIFIGAVIYFGVLFLLRGITRQDLNELIGSFIKRKI